jgi:FdrA protein
MPVIKNQIRPGAYYDSVVLMQLQKGLLALDGVLDAGAVMATQANRDLLEQSGLLTDEANKAGADDLVIVVKAKDESSATNALNQIDALLSKRSAGVDQEFRPRSLEGAVKVLPEAQWVLVSVPGRFAANVAREALNLNRHVFLYSDNVSLADEVELKQTARAKGLLVMGPDCGTAIINGVGLGFANRVRRGNIGLVGASGTGLQAITSHIHQLGGGVSQAIGTGGRDLKADVGAITAHQALEILGRDAATRVIVLVSKPPSPAVAAKLLAAAQATDKPLVVDFIGYPPPARKLGSLNFATSLSEAAEMANQLSVDSEQSSVTVHRSLFTDYYLRGLFSGGTLAYESLLALQATLSPIYSNSPIHESQKLDDPLKSKAHTILDLGEDDFTVGRLHPMMDNDLRIRRLKQEAADPEVGMILLDVVLGEGAHPDPASELAPVIAEIKKVKPSLEVIAIVIGTEDDPQNLNQQVDRLTEAGVAVFRSVTDAVNHIAARFVHLPQSSYPPVSLDSFTQPFAAINVGVESFHASLIGQGAKSVQVEWKPPAGGNEKMAAILAKMKRK